ncbi:MAG TPA: MotA/TolQ/ExbB proton channel family protein [Methylomirabilota bacterium]|nr:MotA/TolQ/ExbB proton channel family protein [Methylomirabilota bacterium]
MPGSGSANGGVAELVLSAGPVAKFVLLLLATFSVICWALIVEKWWEFRKIRRESLRFRQIFREARRFSVVYGAAKKHRDSPLAQLYVAAGQELVTAYGSAEMVDHVLDDADEGLAVERLDATSRALRRAGSAEVARMERYLPFLATVASSAPFIGLFGTVWGIMTAFQNIGQQGSANLAVVAPGISEALVATAAGLGAAIPAVMGYNFFVNRTKHWAMEMEGFTLDLLNAFARPAQKMARVPKDGH